MSSSEHILNEMKEISPLLADAVCVTPYALPKGYFEGLPGSVLQKIQEASAILPGLTHAYQLPENYFETLSDQILSKVKTESREPAEELEMIAPLLNRISKTPVLSVPEGYFEQLQPLVDTHQQERAKVVEFKNYNRWIQYTAAAMVTGILVTGAFMFTDSNSYLEQEKKGRIELRGLPDSAKDAGILKPDTDNSEEVANNIPETSMAVGETIPSIHKSKPSKSTLELLSDEELKRYLEENAIPEPVYPDNTEIEDSL
jgi:hypothetical protein